MGKFEKRKETLLNDLRLAFAVASVILFADLVGDTLREQYGFKYYYLATPAITLTIFILLEFWISHMKRPPK